MAKNKKPKLPKVRHVIMKGLYDYKLIPGKVYPATINHVTADDDGNVVVYIALERNKSDG